MKAYIIYIPSYKQIETKKDVTFNEDKTLNKSRQIHSKEVHEELEAPRMRAPEEDMVAKSQTPEYHDKEEPQRPIDPPHEVNTHKRRPSWEREVIQDA